MTMTIPKQKLTFLTLSVLCFSIIFGFATLLIQSNKTNWHQHQQLEVTSIAQEKALQIEEYFKRTESASAVLGSFIQSHQGNTDDFQNFAKDLSSSLSINNTRVTSVLLAPEGKIRRGYPQEAGEFFDLNLWLHPQTQLIAQKSRAERKLTIVAPLHLRPNEPFILVLQPVFTSTIERWRPTAPHDGDNFWGFTIIAVKVPQLLQALGVSQLDNNGFKHRLWELDQETTLEKSIAGQIINPNAPRFIQLIHLQGKQWYLEIGSKTISFSNDTILLLYALATAIGASIARAVFRLLDSRAEQQIILESTNQKLHETNEKLKSEQIKLRKLSNAVEQSGNSVVITDVKGIIEYVNPRFVEITGYSAEEAIGVKTSILRSDYTSNSAHETLWETILEGKTWIGERRNRRKDGSLFWTKMTISPIRNDKDEIINFVSVSEDVTADKERNLRLEFLANHDPLTELANRRYFLTKLKQAIKRRRRNHVSFVLATLDIDHFDIINQRFGQDIGDLILKELADRLVHCVRTTDLVARVGGDEFSLLLYDVDTVEKAKDVAEKVHMACKQPYRVGETEITITTSLGIALCTNNGISDEKLMHQSATALQQVKGQGRDGYTVIDTNEMVAALISRGEDPVF